MAGVASERLVVFDGGFVVYTSLHRRAVLPNSHASCEWSYIHILQKTDSENEAG